MKLFQDWYLKYKIFNSRSNRFWFFVEIYPNAAPNFPCGNESNDERSLVHRKQKSGGGGEEGSKYCVSLSWTVSLSLSLLSSSPFFLPTSFSSPILICSLGPLWPTKEPAIDAPFLIFRLARSTFALHLRNFKIQIFFPRSIPSFVRKTSR